LCEQSLVNYSITDIMTQSRANRLFYTSWQLVYSFGLFATELLCRQAITSLENFQHLNSFWVIYSSRKIDAINCFAFCNPKYVMHVEMPNFHHLCWEKATSSAIFSWPSNLRRWNEVWTWILRHTNLIHLSHILTLSVILPPLAAICCANEAGIHVTVRMFTNAKLIHTDQNTVNVKQQPACWMHKRTYRW
jgi:hypothetical protein